MKIDLPPLLRFRQKSGFSLVEMLITLGVIGILVTITINSFSQGKRDIIVGVANQRNAQSFATISLCAQMGGVDPVQGTDVEATMRTIITGVTATTGPMAGRTYRIGGLAEEDIPGAAYYLKIANGVLEYQANKPILVH